MKPPRAKILNFATARASSRKGTGNASRHRLQEITEFGSNPGALRAWSHAPPGLQAGAPLVVVLHGCTQNAADYDTGAGWSQLADDWGLWCCSPNSSVPIIWACASTGFRRSIVVAIRARRCRSAR